MYILCENRRCKLNTSDFITLFNFHRLNLTPLRIYLFSFLLRESADSYIVLLLRLKLLDLSFGCLSLFDGYCLCCILLELLISAVLDLISFNTFSSLLLPCQSDKLLATHRLVKECSLLFRINYLCTLLLIIICGI